jgi:hypothetical protein
MCVIMDANCASTYFSQPSAKRSKVLLKWLQSPKGHLAHGGKLTRELIRTPFAPLLQELTRAGKATLYTTSTLDAAERALRRLCISDDVHILALARVSGARVIVSEDKALGADFRNRKILQPVGRVYKSHKHAHLLTFSPTCNSSC